MGLAQSILLNLIIYIILVAVGALLGSRHLWGSRVAAWLDRLQLFSLLALILALGIRLGADEQVIASLGQIGIAALVIAVFSMTGSLLAVTLLRRFILKLDRYGRSCSSVEANPSEKGSGGKADNRLTGWIVAAVLIGMAAGRLFFSGKNTVWCGTVIDFGLYVLLFLVGTDMGRQGNALRDIKAAGFKVLLLPFAVAIGTLSFSLAAALLLPLSTRDTLAVSAGFGWYSLAPTLLAPYSLSLSAIAFLSNVMREILSIIAIPFVSRSVGYLECASLPGAAAMDTVLPVIVGATHERIVIYAFVSGFILSLSVPLLISLLLLI